MVDTPDGNGDHTPIQNGDKSGEKPSKRRRQRKQAKANKGRGTIQGTGENTTPEDPGNLEALEQPPDDPNKPEGQSNPDDPEIQTMTTTSRRR